MDFLARPFFWTLVLIALMTAAMTACKRKGYESPTYQVIESEGAFEIRQYPESTLLTTSMQKRGEDGSFMRLFRFISGSNERQEKISMTTPVIMTGTVSGTMSFVVPKEIVQKGVPEPTDPKITVTTMPAGRYAVYRFKGSIRPSRSEEAAGKLMAWLKDKKIAFDGTPFFAYYNPPWTPGFMRRNEAMIRLSPEKP